MKTISLNAPKSMAIDKMPEAEIATYVAKEADRILAAMPDDLRPVAVNTVRLNRAAAPGVWAEWTRACCDKRKLIDDFVDPVVRDFGLVDYAGQDPRREAHAESQLRVLHLESKSHMK
jgi:hypothetical protein